MGQFLAGGRKPTGTAEATLAIQRRSAGDQRPAGRPESPIGRHEEPIRFIIGRCPRHFASVFPIWENHPTAGSAHRQVFQHGPSGKVVAISGGRRRWRGPVGRPSDSHEKQMEQFPPPSRRNQKEDRPVCRLLYPRQRRGTILPPRRPATFTSLCYTMRYSRML